MKIRNLLLLLTIYSSCYASAFSKPLSVEILRVKADALTTNVLIASLEDALRKKIVHSIDFTLATNNQVDLQLLIANDVKLKKIANHVQLFYKVSFYTRQKILGVSSGSCWQEQIVECAEQILRDAKITIRSDS